MTAAPAVESREWFHTARDGARLFVRSIDPVPGTVRGTVLITHGMGEHLGRYLHVVRRYNALGLRVIAWDLRGHGRSTGRRGDIAHYSVLTGDMLEIWEIAQGGPGPHYLHAHSMGGQIALNFAVEHGPAVAGMIVTSPWLRLAFVPSRLKLLLAAAAARVWPSLTQDTAMGPSRLSRDFDFLKSMPNPELVHHRMSARMYHALCEGGERACRDATRLTYPMLVVHGGCDPVTSAAATEEFFAALRSPDKELVIVPEALHETHNDLPRESVIQKMTEWLDARLPSPTAGL